MADAEEHAHGDDDDEREIGVDAEEGEKPEADIGKKDDDGPLGKEHDPHGAEDEAQADGCDPIYGAEKDAVYQKLNDEMKA